MIKIKIKLGFLLPMPDIITSTTQQFLDIHDITNNFVIMKDGTISVILTVNAMNFGLLAEEEQDAVMYAYAGLLNSLNYPIQIIVNSTTKDVTAYLQLLQDQEEITVNETLRRRINIYREFVANLIQERNVLDKKFYVSIPANAVELGLMGASTVLPGRTKLDITSVERSILLEKAQNLLEPKRDHLIAQFARIGLFSRQLSTQEIIQLFYIRYNPEAAEGQQIGESSSYTSPLVQASIQGSVMNNPIDATNPNPNQGIDAPQAPTLGETPIAPAESMPQPVVATPTAPVMGEAQVPGAIPSPMGEAAPETSPPTSFGQATEPTGTTEPMAIPTPSSPPELSTTPPETSPAIPTPPSIMDSAGEPTSAPSEPASPPSTVEPTLPRPSFALPNSPSPADPMSSPAPMGMSESTSAPLTPPTPVEAGVQASIDAASSAVPAAPQIDSPTISPGIAPMETSATPTSPPTPEPTTNEHEEKPPAPPAPGIPTL